MFCCCKRKKNKLKEHYDGISYANQNIELSKRQEVPNDFGPGYCIQIKGFITHLCYRFAVDLKVASGPESDIAFHLNPRIAMHYIVRNTKINNAWGEEHTASAVKFKHINLNRNCNFDISLFLTETDYIVMVNGKDICKFAYRIPPSKVKLIEVKGKVNVDSIECKKISVFPETPLKFDCIPQGNGIPALPESHLDVPLIYHIQKFPVGSQIEIYGRVKVLPTAFYINLQEGTNSYPHPVVHYHFNPRFNHSHGKLYLASNSWIDGWGNEQRVHGCQLIPDATFSLAIQRRSHHFTVLLDGKIITEYQYRVMDATTIDTLYIQGDVNVKYCYLNETYDDNYHKKHEPKICLSL